MIRAFRRSFSQKNQLKELAYVNGVSDTPLLAATISQRLRTQALKYAKNPFQVFYQHGVSYTYEEFDQRVDEIACGLIALGLEKGDRIGMYSPNRPEWSLIQYAAARADLILVNVNPAFQTDDLKYALNLANIKVLVMPEQFSKSHYVDIVRHLIPDHATSKSTTISSSMVPDLRHVIVCDHKRHKGMINFDELYSNYSRRDRKEMEKRERECDFEAATNIQFTSGTTGYPKGATLTHHNILNNSFMLGGYMGYDSETKICLPVPLYHCFGMVMGSLGALNYGSTAVYPCEGFNPEMSLKAISDLGCHVVYGVPIMFSQTHHEYVQNRDKYNLETLNRGVMAGSICPSELMKKCNKDLGIEYLSIAYGMTETSPVSFQTKRSDPFEKQVGTVGQVHPHAEVKIIDEDGKTLMRGEKGEICTRGYCVMEGYFNDPDKTAECINDKGWMITGDQGILDDEGYLQIVGRVKDMIIRGGENIFPAEIENYLLKHPNIIDAQVIAVKDEKMGEEIMACVILQDPIEPLSHTDIYEFMHGHVAHYKIPKYIRHVKEYPLTVTGKVKKNEMRDENNKILSEVHPDDWEYDFNIFV
ncbi:unnamed protein product [Moneuplotes crassus]|uniref:Uncharacterized protein n=1 Tax=Euplotes crassus TaxID=5936 RepID=A0AAD1U6M8_EUPCR|nr:unnamed protein product [Moneuplotes crassus]